MIQCVFKLTDCSIIMNDTIEMRYFNNSEIGVI